MKRCMGCMAEINDELTICPSCGFSPDQAQREFSLYPDRLPSETILGGRYILGRLLSATDFSMIYLAWDALLEMRVSIREYFPSVFAFRQAPETNVRFYDSVMHEQFELGRQSFEEEGQKVFLIQYLQEVPDYYRIIREFNTSYIVMEYLEGITLEEYKKSGMKSRNLTIETILEHIRYGLNQIHKNGMLHLNLSPDNIYLCDAGRICLMDSGNAKSEFYRLAKCEPDIYREEYIAPEVIEGKKGSRNSDFYSLGCIMYYLYTGYSPERKNLKFLKGITDKKSALAKTIRIMTQLKPENRMNGIN